MRLGLIVDTDCLCAVGPYTIHGLCYVQLVLTLDTDCVNVRLVLTLDTDCYVRLVLILNTDCVCAVGPFPEHGLC